MCGISGLVHFREEIGKDLISEFATSLKHRGPDHVGVHSFSSGFILNTRLSIIDLEGGNQPFFSKNQKIAVIQNGEIYNFIEVRNDLKSKGIVFETSSDTEVILRAYEHYGPGFVSHLNGMFAIAVVDHNTNKLFLYRDRLGVKPLFFFQSEEFFGFSSEIKSFLKIPGFSREINKQAVHHFLNFNYIPLPDTIFRHVLHVLPGYCFEFDLTTWQLQKTRYWDLQNKKEEIIAESDLLNRLEYLIEDAVKIRLRSDVPVAAFLSGGLDSSLVCAIAKKKFDYSFETFTVGFNENDFDESIYAKQLAEYLGLKNNLVLMNADKVNMWNKITWFNDQPHGDISFIPTFLVSQKASERYKVVFSGDGGDEAFGGYLKYLNLLNSERPDQDYFSSISLFDENKFDFKQLYTSNFYKQIEVGSSYRFFQTALKFFSNKDAINQAILFDVKHLLPGNNLVKPDRMAMANSLEVRSPLLDYRIYELMFSVSGDLKVSNELGTKHLLKKLAVNYLPENLVYRKKQMFTVPVGEWFKKDLLEYLKKHLKDESFIERGIFNPDYIDSMIESHAKGTHNFTRELRAILALKLWFDEFLPRVQ
jgi:asparagine synthase (glutamine-hydrolysing)